MSRFFFSIVLLAALLASAQSVPTVPATTPTIISAVAYPGPVVTSPAGNSVEIQYELVLTDGSRVRSMLGTPVSLRYFEYGGAQAAVSCDWVRGKCKINSLKPGAVRVNLSNAEGGFGYSGGSVIINFTPAAQSSKAGEVILPVTVTTSQANEGEIANAFVTVPQDFGNADNPVEIMVRDPKRQGNDRYTYFPSGVKAGQRLEVGKFDIQPMTEPGSQSVSVELRHNKTGLVLGRGDTELCVKYGWQPFSVTMDYNNNIVATGQFPQDGQYRIVLLRGDGFYLPLSTFQYSQGNRYELIAYNGGQSGGSEYHLPGGYYSIAVIGEFPGSTGGYMRVVNNALYLDRELTLK